MAIRHNTKIPSSKFYQNYGSSKKQQLLNNYATVSRQIQKQTPIKLDKYALLEKGKKHLTNNIINIKQQNIKTIDSQIQRIMQKHLNNKNNLYQKNVANTFSNQNNNIEGDSYKQNWYQTTTLQKNQSLFKPRRQQHVLQQRKNKLLELHHNQLTKQFRGSKQIDIDKYDKEIKRLNQRIKKIQGQKSKYNIQFRPFTLQRRTQKTSLNPQTRYESCNNNRKRENGLAVTVSAFNQKHLSNKKSQIGLKGCIKHQKSANQKESIKENTVSFKQILEANYKLVALNIITQQTTEFSLKQLAQALGKQITLDEQLRNIKIWFTFSHENNKWNILKEAIINKKIAINQQQVKQIFESSLQQHNPFFKFQDIPFNKGLQLLLSAYSQSESHWSSVILGKWDKNQLLYSKLKPSLLADQKSLFITLDDLTKFINLQIGSFYRNRDLFLIYKRLCSKNNHKIQYIAFIEALSTPIVL